jgi:hypothetical protein
MLAPAQMLAALNCDDAELGLRDKEESLRRKVHSFAQNLHQVAHWIGLREKSNGAIEFSWKMAVIFEVAVSVQTSI